MSSIVSPFGGQGIKQVGGFGGNGGGFGQQGMNQPNQFGPQSGGFGGNQQGGGFGGMGGGFGGMGGGFGGMGNGFGGQQSGGFGGGFGGQQQSMQYNQQQQQYNPYQQQQQYNPYQQQQQYNPYQQQPQQYNPFPYQQQQPQQQQFNPYQQQFNPYQQFGYGQRQQMENPYQRQQQQFMNRGQDRGGFDDRATGFDGSSIGQPFGEGGSGLPPDPTQNSNTGSFYGSQNSFHAPPEGVMGTMGGYGGFLGSAGSGQSQEEFNRTTRNAGPTPGDMQYRGATPGGSTNDILKSLVGLGADPNNTAQRTMQDAMNAQRAQATPTPARPPMQPPFNPYQQFNYGGGSDPRGRGGYKNDRRFGGRLPGAVDPGFSYPPPRPDLPNMTIPERNLDGSKMADDRNPDGTEMARLF
jgi:hypothetical protein